MQKYQRNMTLRSEAEEADAAAAAARSPDPAEPARRAPRKRRHDEVWNIAPSTHSEGLQRLWQTLQYHSD